MDRDVPDSHASSANCSHGDREDLVEKAEGEKKKETGRNTKIRTARGVRDRRVRLSLEVSRKFFCLHDALGFNTASDTLEWLISESSNAIEEVRLSNEVPCAPPRDSALARNPAGHAQAKKEARRECRARARARARERTEAKRNHNNDGCSSNSPVGFAHLILPSAMATSDPTT